MLPADFSTLLDRLMAAGFGDDLAWAENLGPPADADEFAHEVIFVICNSGMRYTVAQMIYERCVGALYASRPVSEVFGHKGKAGAIEDVWARRSELFNCYCMAGDKLTYLESLSWVGPITKFHLAKNFGLQYAKPDVHLQRLANLYKTSPQSLCESLARFSGLKVATVDTVLWRAAATGILNTSTGAINERVEK